MSPTSKLYVIAALAGLVLSVSAAKPTSFCKCTCFTNSTIIPLDAHLDSPLTREAFLTVRSSESDDDVQDPVPDPPPKEDEKEDEEPAGDDEDKHDGKDFRAGSCSDCTRQFCLDYNLPICKKAEIEDVYTTCFQRDSRKDEAVVFIFIIATVGLLIYATVKPWISSWVDAAKERGNYIPVSTGQT